MDILSGVIALVLLLVFFAVIGGRSGLLAIQAARKMTFYRLRRQREARGWRILGVSILLLLLAILLPIFALPIAYEYFPPTPAPTVTPTITVVPSITLTSTITLTPTITDTPLVTDTPTASPTPFIPAAIEALFQSSVTPNPKVVFSTLQFTTDGFAYPVSNPGTVFQNPVGHMYAIFTYDQMIPGTQWTALWFHEGTLIHYQTLPWDGGTGGVGFTDWNPSPDQWVPGLYEVQNFVGEEFVGNGRFLVQGTPPTLAPTITPTFTKIPTHTLVPSSTITPSRTPPPSGTPTFTLTIKPSPVTASPNPTVGEGSPTP
jgi:type VI secretion system secreted protein VgrG